MTEIDRVLLAADLLMERGYLSREDDPRLADILVGGAGFRYLRGFWQRVGLLASDTDHAQSQSPIDAVPDVTDPRLRVAVEWAAAGAPFEWARAEAGTAIESFLSDSARGGGVTD